MEQVLADGHHALSLLGRPAGLRNGANWSAGKAGESRPLAWRPPGQGSRVSAALSYALGAERVTLARPFKQSSEASQTFKSARVSEASKNCCEALTFVALQIFGGWGARAAVSRGGAPPPPRADGNTQIPNRGRGEGGRRHPRSHPEPACRRRVRRGCER